MMPSLVIPLTKKTRLFAGTDLSPIMPVLAKVFDQALAGGALGLAVAPWPCMLGTVPLCGHPMPSLLLLLLKALFGFNLLCYLEMLS